MINLSSYFKQIKMLDKEYKEKTKQWTFNIGAKSLQDKSSDTLNKKEKVGVATGETICTLKGAVLTGVKPLGLILGGDLGW